MADTRIASPIAIITEPLTVQLGLPYINEELGPTADLLCNVIIIPRVINTRPATINDLPKRFFGFID